MQRGNQFTKVMNSLYRKLIQVKKQLDEMRFYYESGRFEYALNKTFDVEETVEKAVLLSRALPAYTGNPSAVRRVEGGYQKHGTDRNRLYTAGLVLGENPHVITKEGRGQHGLHTRLYISCAERVLQRQATRQIHGLCCNIPSRL